MRIAHAAWGLTIATSLLVGGCNKKPEGGAGGAGSAEATSGTTVKPTGITGTYNGKPWTGKVAWLKPDAETPKDSILYIMAGDSKCKMPDIMGDELGMVQVTSTPKKGVAAFDKDNTYGQLFWKKGSTMSSKEVNTGEIEWLAIPTATTKGVARIRLQKDADTKIEGSMEVSLCPK